MADNDLISEHKELIDIFKAAADATSDMITIEDCPNQEISSVLHISQVMLSRAQEQALAAIELFLSGHWAAFEALSRISLEYSIRVSSLCKDDPRVGFGQYFGEHFQEMKKRQRQMGDSLVLTNDQHALLELEKEKQSLIWREEAVKGYAEFCGFILKTDHPTSTLTHFNALEKTILYRGLYSVLSSQVHADAASLIDYIITHCVQRTDDEKSSQAKEVYHWMLHYLVKIIGEYIEACENFASCFLLEDMSLNLVTARSRFLEIEKIYDTRFNEFRTKPIYP